MYNTVGDARLWSCAHCHQLQAFGSSSGASPGTVRSTVCSRILRSLRCEGHERLGSQWLSKSMCRSCAVSLPCICDVLWLAVAASGRCRRALHEAGSNGLAAHAPTVASQTAAVMQPVLTRSLLITSTLHSILCNCWVTLLSCHCAHKLCLAIGRCLSLIYYCLLTHVT